MAEPKYSRSLEFGLAIIGCFTTKQQVLRVSELADMIKVSRSTTHRYAMTLVELGYLEQDKSRRYRLTRRAGDPGIAFINTLRTEAPTARTLLEDLREATGHTVSMGVLDGKHVLYTYRLFAHGRGQYEADLGIDVGAYVPAYCTAIGKALLASLDVAERRKAIARLRLKAQGPKTITDKTALVDNLLAVHAVGIAVCDEEQAQSVRSIAAAITRAECPRPMAISVTVPAKHMTLSTMRARLGPHVLAAAQRI
ncbi:MAG TPA: IclR family transcriptional regulator C-terminal domain-containing protein [Solirubrobacteraceae bacterium]|jgi:IclR family pca regulon transcriptional regulator